MPFKKGESGNPKGRPKRKDTTYYAAIKEAVTIDDWKIVMTKALEQAKNGDTAARTFLASYLLGNPENYLTIDMVQDIIIKVELDE